MAPKGSGGVPLQKLLDVPVEVAGLIIVALPRMGVLEGLGLRTPSIRRAAERRLLAAARAARMLAPVASPSSTRRAGPQALTTSIREPAVMGLIALAYLAGSIPFGLVIVIAKLFAGKDVRESGSGNIGATNVARVVGKKLGVLTLLLDAAKGFIPVFIAGRMAMPSGVDREFVVGLKALAAL